VDGTAEEHLRIGVLDRNQINLPLRHFGPGDQASFHLDGVRYADARSSCRPPVSKRYETNY